MKPEAYAGLVTALKHICTGYAHLQLNQAATPQAQVTLAEMKGPIISLLGRIPQHALRDSDTYATVVRTGDAQICKALPLMPALPRMAMSFDEMVRIITLNPEHFFFLCHYGMSPSQNNGPFAELMDLMMTHCLKEDRPDLWRKCAMFLHRHKTGLMPLIFWARRPGKINDERAAYFIADFLYERCEADPKSFSQAIHFAVKRGKPMAIAILHMAGGRAGKLPDFIEDCNDPILEAYSSEHRRLRFENRFGPLPRLLLEFDETTLCMDKYTP